MYVRREFIKCNKSYSVNGEYMPVYSEFDSVACAAFMGASCMHEYMHIDRATSKHIELVKSDYNTETSKITSRIEIDYSRKFVYQFGENSEITQADRLTCCCGYLVIDCFIFSAAIARRVSEMHGSARSRRHSCSLAP